MRSWAIGAAVVILAMTLTAPVSALADDGNLGDVGGTPHPVQSTTVRMESETVQAVLYGAFAEYRCDFKFVNSGSAQLVHFGFPFELPQKSLLKYWSPPAGYRAWRNGAPIEVTARNGMDGKTPTLYYTHDTLLEHGATMITVDYFAIPSTSEGWAGYDYVLHSGASWAGTIGKAVIRYTQSADFVGYGAEDEFRANYTEDGTSTPESQVALSYTKPTAGTYQWVFRDIEPRVDANGDTPYDFGFNYSIDGWAPELPVRRVVASSSLRLDVNDYSANKAADGNPSTAWAEDSAGSGVGQWFRIDLNAAQPVREVRILPGYAKRSDLFYKYNRPKSVLIELSDGTRYTARLRDEPSYQRFAVNGRAKWAKFTILDVYRGTTRNETYVSEVELGKQPAPAILPYAQLVRESVATTGTALQRLPRWVEPASSDDESATGLDAAENGAVPTTSPSRVATAPPRPPASEPTSPLGAAALVVVFAGGSAVLWRMAG